MIFLQTLVFPEAVPPATPIKKGEESLLGWSGGLGEKGDPLDLVGDDGGVNGGGSLILSNSSHSN